MKKIIILRRKSKFWPQIKQNKKKIYKKPLQNKAKLTKHNGSVFVETVEMTS